MPRLAATIVATFDLKANIGGRGPLWTALVSKITYVFDVGSIQMEVPVKPVCP